MVRHGRLRRIGTGRRVGGHAHACRALPDPKPPAGGLRRLHEQDQLRFVPRALGAAGELRRGIADGHHRGRPRPRSPRAPAEEHRARGRRRADGAGPHRGRSRGVPSPRRGRDRLEGSTTAGGTWQRDRVRLVDDDRRLVGRIYQGQPGRHHRAEHRGGRDRNRRPDRRRAGSRRGSRRRAGRHQRRLSRHALDALRLRRARQPHRVRRRQRVPGRRRRSQAPDPRPGIKTPRRRGARTGALRRRRGRRGQARDPGRARADLPGLGRRADRPRHLRGPADAV